MALSPILNHFGSIPILEGLSLTHSHTRTHSSVFSVARGLKEGPVFSFHIHKSFIHLTASVF